VQNIVSSLFNSHLFDFTSGWLYVFGVGVVGGMVLRQKDLGKDIPLALSMVGIKNPAS
jgi:O-antigen ligase